MRHIEVNQLWLQEKVTNGDIQVMKVKGEGNLADALTKALDGPGTRKHIGLSGQETIAGRHSLTPDFVTEEQEDVSKDEAGEEDGEYMQDELCAFVGQWPAGVELLELLCLSKVSQFVPSGIG